MNDDAGRGRRGRRPRLTDALVRGFEGAYGRQVRSATDLGGSCNLNVRLDTDGGTFVLRAYRDSVDQDRVLAIQQARIALADAGLPTARPIPCRREGATATTVAGVLVEVEPHVTWDQRMDTLPRVAQALPVLGQVHDVLADLELGPAARGTAFVNHVGPDDLVARVRRGTDRIRAWRPTTEEAALADAADLLAAEATVAHEDVEPHLPAPQLVHGDFWDDNVLFQEGRVVLVADLDFMDSRLRIDDLALVLHYVGFLLGRPTAATDLRGLTDRYDLEGRPLTAGERTALPIALARQPLWSLAVWAAELDDEGEARRHVEGHLAVVDHGLRILRELDRWQDALA